MPVTKTTRECYEVRENREWANITLRCWENPPEQGSQRGINYGGEIVINSGFGAWANTWTACGVPFKEFLASTSFDYLFTKLMGTKLDCFDGAATLVKIKQDILELRRSGDLDKDGAREVWISVSEEEDRIRSNSEDSYGYAMFDVARSLDRAHPMRDYFSDPSGWPKRTHNDHQAEGFWRDLWPSFKNELQMEAAGSKDLVNPNVPKTPRVLVVVSGGVADAYCDDGVDFELFDWDAYKDDPKGTVGVSERFADLAAPIGVPVEGSAVPVNRPRA